MELSQDELIQLLLRLIKAKQEEDSKDIALSQKDAEKTAKLLVERFSAFAKTYNFKPGDLVQWKQGFKNKKLPHYGQPAIVIEVLENPIHDTSEDAGSPYFREPLDIVLGLIDESGDFLIFHYDKRRFKPFELGSSGPENLGPE